MIFFLMSILTINYNLLQSFLWLKKKQNNFFNMEKIGNDVVDEAEWYGGIAVHIVCKTV